jgi:hypothetical protein
MRRGEGREKEREDKGFLGTKS